MPDTLYGVLWDYKGKTPFTLSYASKSKAQKIFAFFLCLLSTPTCFRFALKDVRREPKGEGVPRKHVTGLGKDRVSRTYPMLVNDERDGGKCFSQLQGWVSWAEGWAVNISLHLYSQISPKGSSTSCSGIILSLISGVVQEGVMIRYAEQAIQTLACGSQLILPYTTYPLLT